jgi:putative redox protein
VLEQEETMGKSRVVWVEKGQFVGTDSSKHSVVMSTQDAENATGLMPSDMLLLSLAGCTAVDVVSILEKKRQPARKLEIEIDAVQGEEPPWAFERIALHYRVQGKGLTEEAVRRSIELAESKYCSVAAALRPQVPMTFDFEIVPEPSD